jgi:hypothetical protein
MSDVGWWGSSASMLRDGQFGEEMIARKNRRWIDVLDEKREERWNEGDDEESVVVTGSEVVKSYGELWWWDR